MKKQQLYNLIKQRIQKILKEQDRQAPVQKQPDDTSTPTGGFSLGSKFPGVEDPLVEPDMNWHTGDNDLDDPNPADTGPAGYTTACNVNVDYGDLVFYDSTCNTGNINSHYICCDTGNNSGDPETLIGSDVTIPYSNFPGGYTIPAQTSCWCPNPTITNPYYCTDNNCTSHTMQPTPHTMSTCGQNQTWANDNCWEDGLTTTLDSCDIGIHPTTSTSANNFGDLQAWMTANGLALTPGFFDVQNGDNCVGCVQTAANSATYQIDFNGNSNQNVLGCLDGYTTNGISWDGGPVPDPNDISCCAFDGCTADGSTPAATNVSTFTLNDGTTITANETDTWSGGTTDFVDDNSCLFPGCTGITVVDAAGIDHTDAADPVTGLGNNSSGNYSVVTTDNSTCEVFGCTDNSVTGLVDTLGNALVNNYLGAAGANNNGSINYTITDDGTCEVWACTVDTAFNYFDPTNYSGVTFTNETSPTNNASLCQFTGCMDQTAGENVDVDGNDQNGNAATEPVPNNGGYSAINFDPNATLQYQGGNDPNYPGGDPCQYNIPIVTGCTDSTALNYYCLNPGVGNPPCDVATSAGVLPLNTDGTQLVFDSTPSMCNLPVYGCMTNGFNGDGSNAASAYDASHNVEETSDTDDTNPCVYKGCVTEPSSGTYICNTNPGYLLCKDASSGAQLTTPDPTGIVDTTNTWGGVTAATFTHDANACTFQGCTDSSGMECGNYQPGYNLDCNGDDINDVNYTQALGWNSCCDYSCVGCAYKQDNAQPTNWNASYTIDNGDCEFYYCLEATATAGQGTPQNYVCNESTNDLYELCEDGNGNQLTAPDPNGIIRDGIANQNGSGVDMGTFFNIGCRYGDLGCDNPLATNYDPNATGGGECEFEGCGDPLAENYAPLDPLGTAWEYYDVTPIQNGGICEFRGCAVDTHPTDQNASSIAGTLGNDDGYHQYNDGCFTSSAPVSGNGISPTGNLDIADISCCQWEGCMDPTSPNYSPAATVDDGSCVVECKNVTAKICNPKCTSDKKYHCQRSYSCMTIGGQEPNLTNNSEFRAQGHKIVYVGGQTFTNITPVINTSHNPSYPPFGTYAGDGDYRQDTLTGLWYYWSSNASAWIFDSNYNTQQGNSENSDGTWTGVVEGYPEYQIVPNAVWKVININDSNQDTPQDYPKAFCKAQGDIPYEDDDYALGEGTLGSQLLKSKKLRQIISKQVFKK